MSQKSKCKKIAEAAPEMCTVAYFTPRAQRVHDTANRSPSCKADSSPALQPAPPDPSSPMSMHRREFLRNAAGATAITIDADRTLIVAGDRFVQAADAAGIVVVARAKS